MMKQIQVLIPHIKLPALDYLIPDNIDIHIGSLVIVPLRNKQVVAIVSDISPNYIDQTKLKTIVKLLDISLSQSLVQFILRAAKYYLAPPGSICKLMFPIEEVFINTEFNRDKALSKTVACDLSLFPALSTEQSEALHQLLQYNNDSVPFLLKGITGSGKTEVYFYHIAELLNQGKQVLVMIPEIGLSTQIMERFTQRFGFKPAIWNSSITKAKKKKLLLGIVTGEVLIIIGTRSALFLPYKNLGLIVVDEEHDASYKQEDGVLYNARDMAILRGMLCNHPVLLASATPSVETLYNASIGKYKLIELSSRFGESILPEVKIIDMKRAKQHKTSWISNILEQAIGSALSSGHQSMLFLNRRGYAPMLLCSSCGGAVSCKFCSSSLVVHLAKKKLECHHCGYVSSIKSQCTECGAEDSLVPCGPGVERLAEEVVQKFPNARIQIVTKDEMKSEAAIQDILSDVQNNMIDIIIGTQVIAKGYHFPNLELVGVIDADNGLIGSDLRGPEKMFQLLSQVSGRAGRESTCGKVYLQTFNPQSKLIQMLQKHEFDRFIQNEIESRKDANMPPFSRICAILLSYRDEREVMLHAKRLVSFAPQNELIRVLGPVPAMMSKLQNLYRYRILVITDRKIDIQAYITQWFSEYKMPTKIRLKIDIDPYSFN